MNEKISKMNSNCTLAFSTSMGLPCRHLIRKHQNMNDILHMTDVHQRWWFNIPLPGPVPSISLGHMNIRNPKVMKGKGWPKGSKKHLSMSSTQRNPSKFEREAALQHCVLCSRK